MHVLNQGCTNFELLCNISGPARFPFSLTLGYKLNNIEPTLAQLKSFTETFPEIDLEGEIWKNEGLSIGYTSREQSFRLFHLGLFFSHLKLFTFLRYFDI